MRFKKQFLIIFLVLTLAALACEAGGNLPTSPTGLPSIPTLDPNLSETFESEWQKSMVEAVAAGQFSVTITEGQLTDFFNRKNAQNPNATLSNVQVFLRDGQIQFYGATNHETGSTTLQITATVSVTDAGKLQFNVVSAQLGPIPVPEAILSSVSQFFNDALNGQGTTGADQIQLQRIVITDGYMTITGTLK
jgi:hypothetical protein